MSERINQEIRFYQPADPYYYQVDNLPLEDLLSNDVKLQDQIDTIQADTQNTVFRDGFMELRPYVNQALPGTVSVHPGSFIGRTQRSSGGALTGSTTSRTDNGILEILKPPTTGDTYNISNGVDPAVITNPAKYVGRTSVFNFMGGSISIDSFNYDAFYSPEEGTTTPPLGRLDLIGITTVNGAMDDPYLPGNQNPGGIEVGDGLPKLAVLKGAGIVQQAAGQREIVIGEKYISLGESQESINDYGRDIDGNVVPNPTFGTIPSPDDIVNACMATEEVVTSMQEYADNNRNASFFLPLAYVFVPQSHIEGNPIPASYVKDIRPFFRTAELTLGERQALAMSEMPSWQNAVVTRTDQAGMFFQEINRTPGSPKIQEQLTALQDEVNSVTVQKTYLMKTPLQFRYGGVGHGSEYSIQAAIQPEHAGKTIVSVEGSMRPRTSTGDIGNGWAGVQTINGSTIWVINWGNVISHTSAILVSPGFFRCAPRGQNGSLKIRTSQSGTNLTIYGYITGYTYEDTLTF